MRRDIQLSAVGQGIGVFLIYAAVIAVLTVPLAFDPAGFTPSGIDSGATPWKIWWTAKAVFDQHSFPYWCDYLQQPYGITLLFYNPCVLYGFLSLPALAISRSPALIQGIANFWVLFTFPLASSFAYLLCRRYAIGRPAALLGGSLFGFSPLRLSSLSSLNLLSTYWLPLFFLFALPRVAGSIPPMRRGLLMGACILGAFLSSLTAWLLLLFCSLILIVDSLPLFRKNSAEEWRKSAASWPIAAIPMALWCGLIWALSPSGVFSSECFARPTDAIIERLSSHVIDWVSRSENDHLARYTLGWGPMFLAILGLLSRRRPSLPGVFKILLVLSLLLSLGPRMRLGSSEDSFSLPGPFLLFRHLGPPLSFFRTPHRFLHLVSLIIALGAAQGIHTLMLARKESILPWKRRALTALTAAAFLLPLAEFGTTPVIIEKREPEPAMEWIRNHAESDDEGVLILPGFNYEDRAEQRFAQVTHDHPSPLVPLPRAKFRAAPPDRGNTLLGFVVNGRDDLALGGQSPDKLRSIGIVWVVVSESTLSERPRLRSWLEERWTAPVFRDESHRVYRIEEPPF
ncbi:MAG: hypothetical protein JW958_13905 [Candidatus Eisenbacteria bacterium]|nr:hypothetical protein [Candidatus Eisenbacteria bacterium]